MAARIIATSGMLVVMIEASTGEVIPTPKMKHPWLKTIASSEAPKSFIMSAGGTCSGLRKSEAVQKRSIAPATRRSVTTSGVTTPPAMTALATGDIRPHMALAPSMAPWPFNDSYFMFFPCL